MRLHLDLACVKLNDTELELNNTKAKLNNTEVKLNDTEEKTRELMKKFDILQRQLHDTQDNLEKAKQQVMKFDTNQAQFSLQLDLTEFKLNKAEHKLNDTQEKLETARKQVEKLDQRFGWKIENFSNLLRQAKTGETLFFSSNPFCGTESCGYKLKVRIDPNGFGSGKNTHLSVHIYVMKGKYDAILPWPFKKKVTITLIDQQEDLNKRENVIMSFIPGNSPQSFARPTQEENSAGYGYPEFISHEKLHSRRYLVDDTLFLQTEIGL